jgi:hypothetical protein
VCLDVVLLLPASGNYCLGTETLHLPLCSHKMSTLLLLVRSKRASNCSLEGLKALLLLLLLLLLHCLIRFVLDGSLVLYPFAYGLSYSSFTYSQLQLLKNEEDGCVNVGAEPAFCFRVTVTNSGNMAGEHSVPLFLSHEVARVSTWEEDVSSGLSVAVKNVAASCCWLETS